MGLISWAYKKTKRVVSDVLYYSVDCPWYYTKQTFTYFQNTNRKALTLSTYCTLGSMAIYAYVLLFIIWLYVKSGGLNDGFAIKP